MGVSYDPYTRNEDWAVDQGFQYELWTDDNRDLAVHYGAAVSAASPFPGRVSRLIGADGHVILEYPFVSTGTHPQEVLEDCELLFGP